MPHETINIRTGDFLGRPKGKDSVGKEMVLRKGQAKVGCLHLKKKKKCIDVKNKQPLLHTWIHNASNDLKTYGTNMIPYQSGQIGIANT